MNRCNILSLSILTGFGLALLPASAVSQPKSLKDQLVGTWNIVSWERTAPDGTKIHTFGTNPKGINYFGPDGRFFIMWARPDLPKLSSNDRTTAPKEEIKTVYLGTLAYFGTYTVDEASKTITYRIETTTFPNQLGVQQKRVISLMTADDLKYQNPTSTPGGQIEITLKRAK